MEALPCHVAKTITFFIVFIIKSQAILLFKAGYLTSLEHSPSAQSWHVELITLDIGTLCTKMTLFVTLHCVHDEAILLLPTHTGTLNGAIVLACWRTYNFPLRGTLVIPGNHLMETDKSSVRLSSFQLSWFHNQLKVMGSARISAL